MKYQMKFRVLAGTAAGLGLLIILSFVFSPGSRAGRASSMKLAANAKSAASLEISSKTESVSLVKSGNAWVLKETSRSLPANKERIDAFLSALASVSSMERVGSSKAVWKDFGLEGGDERTVALKDGSGREIATILLGASALSGSDVYVAPSGGEQVYLVSGGFSSYAKGAKKSWLDLRLFPDAPSDGTGNRMSLKGKLALDADGKDILEVSYALEKTAGVWKGTVVGAPNLDQAKVAASVRAVMTAKADDFAELGSKLDSPALTVTVEAENGKSYSLAVGPRLKDGRYLAVANGSSMAVYLPAWAVTDAFKRIPDLTEKEASK